MWNSTTTSYAGTQDPGADVTPMYTYVGVPWYPAVTLSVAVNDGSGAQVATLAGGESAVIKGINFAPGTAKVHYDGHAVSAVFSSNQAATATLPSVVPSGASTCVGASADVTGNVSIANLLSTGAQCPFLSVPATSITLSRSLAERDVTSDLIAHLAFYGDARDSSGTGNDGTASGAVLAPNADGAANQAYRFPSATASISVPNLNTAKSIALWIKLDESAFPSFEFATSSATLDEYLKCQNPDNGVTVKGVWQFMAGSFPMGASSTNGSVVWLNGVEPSTASAKQVIISLLHAVISTGRLGGSTAFIGTVDAFWAWSREICIAEVKNIYSARGFALRFNGLQGGVAANIPIGTATSNPSSSAFTLVAWVRPDSVAGRQSFIGQQLATSPPLTGFSLGVDRGMLSATVRVECPATSCGCEQYREARHWRAALEAGRWSHVAAAYDGSSWTLFIDGMLKANVPFSGGSIFSSNTDITSPILLGAEGTIEGVAGGPSEIQ